MMKWLDKLERKYHKYTVHNLIQYIVGGMAVVFVLSFLNKDIASILAFSPELIMQGQIWRIITFIFLPRTYNAIWIIFSLMFFYFAGNTIEQHWGAFKFNVYYLVGTMGTMLAGIIAAILLGSAALPLTNYYLNLTMLLALTQIIPDYEIRIYFILPVKLKYMGWLLWAYLLFDFVGGNALDRIVILVSIANYAIFFLPSMLQKGKQNQRKQQYKQAHSRGVTAKQRPRNKSTKADVIQVAFHCCESCGRTEVDNPELEFRYCSKCDGHHEYCTEHILTHKHIKE